MYPQKVNTHTWDTAKPALLLEDQLIPDKKAPQSSTDSALLGEHPLHLQKSTEGPAVPEWTGGAEETSKETIYKAHFCQRGCFTEYQPGLKHTHNHMHTLNNHQAVLFC